MPRFIKEALRKEKKVVCKNCGRTIGYFLNDVKEYHGVDINVGSDGCK